MVFTPFLYRILGVYLGTVLLVTLSLWIVAMAGSPMALFLTAVMLIPADVMLDFFVFQGIFSKGFDYGILRNSYEGLSVLKAGVLGDQLRRLLQITIVMSICAASVWGYVRENGFITSAPEYVYFIAALILLIYSLNTLILNITRKHLNYAEALLPQMLSFTVSGAAVGGMFDMFMNENDTDSVPWLLVMIPLALIVTYCMVARIGNRYLMSFGEKKMNRFGTDDRKKLIIFLLIAFGIDFLMLPVMYIGYQKGADLSAVLVAQMMYPACGVVLAKLTSYNEGKLPKFAYGTILATGLFTIILAVHCATCPMPYEANGAATSVQYLASSYVAVLGSILLIIALCVVDKEKREKAGFRFHNAGKSIFFMFLFFFLYFARIIVIYVVGGLIDGNLAEYMSYFAQIFTADGQGMLWFNALISAPLSFIIFLGEEYGWRYYLQPIMQKKFGVLPGTILLGIIWGIWHAGADYMYYSDGTGIQMLCSQIVTCVSLGIFWGYAYMKTNNIWVPVMMHYLNNNLVMVIAGDASTQAMQGSVVSWSDIPVLIIGASVFWLFALAPTMRGKAVAEKAAENNEEVA